MITSGRVSAGESTSTYVGKFCMNGRPAGHGDLSIYFYTRKRWRVHLHVRTRFPYLGNGSATPERVTFERASFERTIFSDCTFERLTIRAIDYLNECHFSDYQIQRVSISTQPIWASFPLLPQGTIWAKAIMAKSEHLSLKACAEQWTYTCHVPVQEKIQGHFLGFSNFRLIFDLMLLQFKFGLLKIIVF